MAKEDEVIEYVNPSKKKSPHPGSLILDGDAVETPSPTKQESSQQQFDWRDARDSIVVQYQPATAVYKGHGDGLVVIRQEDIWGDGRDCIVHFAPELAEKIVEAILAVAKGAK
jgi:hypothetical protein